MARLGRTQDDLFDHSQTYGSSSRAGIDFETWRERQRGGHAENGSGKLVTDILIGLIAGAAATWVMTEYQVHSNKLLKKLETGSQQQSESSGQESTSQNPTVAVANRISQAVRRRDVSEKHKELAGNLVHYGFGMMNGALFGLLRDRLPLSSPLRGLIFGAGVWAAADEALVPALGMSRWWPEYPTSVHLKGLGAHLVYGASVDALNLGLWQLMRAGQQVIGEAVVGLKEDLQAEEKSAEFGGPMVQPGSSQRKFTTLRYRRVDLGEAA